MVETDALKHCAFFQITDKYLAFVSVADNTS